VNPEFVRDLWITHTKLGDLLLQTGNLSLAEAHYGIALRFTEMRRTSENEENSEILRARATMLERLGTAMAARNADAAERLYRDCLALRRRTYRGDPSSLEYARDLLVILARLGELGVPDSVSHLQEAFDLSKYLHGLSPGNLDITRDLAVTSWRLAYILFKGDLSSAAVWKACADAMRELNASDVVSRTNLQVVAEDLKKNGYDF
jgi:tetratricopeptide (TPR) repeat protein